MTCFTADFDGADVRPSPNFGERRGVARPDSIVLHYTGMEGGPAAEAWLCNPQSEVSAHYVVHEDGRVVQLVPERLRAWHAGRGSWHGETDMNSRSVGIEIVNPGHAFGYPPFPAAQIEVLIELCRDICARQGIPPERVIAHSDLAPGRKIDPGEKFPWPELAAQGVGLFVEPVPLSDGEVLRPGDQGAAVEELQSMLETCGYDVVPTGLYDEQTKIVVEAFQRHFRQSCVDGLADVSTVSTLRKLIDRLKAAPSIREPSSRID